MKPPSLSKIFGILASLLLVGMFIMVLTMERPALVGSEKKTFIIEALDPPKHVYADLRDDKGTLLKRVYVSKHCNRWQEIKLGSSIVLTVNHYALAEKRWSEINAYPVCPGYTP